MTTKECDNVRLSAMAIADGEEPPLSSAEVEIHLAHCRTCAAEATQLAETSRLLSTPERRPRNEDLWPLIKRRLDDTGVLQERRSMRLPFLVMGIFLLGYKLTELIPDRHFGFWFKLIPVIAVMLIFVYLRQNPFRINPELRLEVEGIDD
jgi:hypothetical protein